MIFRSWKNKIRFEERKKEREREGEKTNILHFRNICGTLFGWIINVYLEGWNIVEITVPSNR